MSNLNNKTVRNVLIVCMLGLFIDGYILYISSIALPFINQTYVLSSMQLGMIQSAAPLGTAIGAIIIGKVSDHAGRKNMLIINLIFFVIIALLSAIAWNPTSLIIIRFLIGFGIGMDYPICAAYLTEMSPKNKTKQYMAIAMFCNCMASPVGVIVAWIIFSIYQDVNAWRFMLASSAIPAIIALIYRARLPESFLWKAHNKLYKKNKNQTNLRTTYSALFSNKYIISTIGFGLCWFFMNISYYGIGLFTPMLLTSIGISSNATFLDSATDMILATLFVNLFIVLGALGSIFIITKVNPIKLQKSCFLVSCVGLLLLAFCFIGSIEIRLSMAFLGFILFNFFINFGPGITTYLLPAQLYPTNIRATGHGFAAGIAKIGAFLGTATLPVIQSLIGTYNTLFILAITLLAGFFLSNLLSDKTSGNKLTCGTNRNGAYSEIPTKQSAN